MKLTIVLYENSIMHPIYSEMIKRNYGGLLKADATFVGDPLLGSTDDTRRCIAIVADGVWEFSDRFNRIVDELSEVVGDSAVKPAYHHTFLTALPFINVGDQGYPVEGEYLDRLEEFIREHMKIYDIAFDKIVPVHTGIAVVGGDDILDYINSTREMFRKAGLIENERYKADILHFTVMRFKGEVDAQTKDRVLEIIKWANDGHVYGRLSVQKIKIIEASWLLHPDECKVLREIELYYASHRA